MKRIFSYSEKYTSLGLLFLRLAIGILFIYHGWPKLTGGREVWIGVGSAMTTVGIDFGFTYWGLMASCAEFFGGILLIIGLLTRPAAFFMFFTMLIAMIMHLSLGQGLGGIGASLHAAIIFLMLIFTGPGKISLDKKLFK